MGRSLGFASTTCDYFRPIKTRFRYGSTPEVLNLATNGNSPAHYAKGTQSLIVRKRTIELLQLVSVWFQVLLTPLIGVLFIVRSRYFALSVVEEYLALEGGPPSFTRSFTGTVLLWYVDSNGGQSLSPKGLSPAMAGLSRPFD